MSGLGDLSDALADCDAQHFTCRECDAGEHDRPTLHAEEALVWFAEQLADHGMREAVAASVAGYHRPSDTLGKIIAGRALAAVRDHLGRVDTP